jgi:ribonuclease-3
MEEEPVEIVPDTEVKDDFIISHDECEKQPEKHVNVFQEEVFEDKPSNNRRNVPMYSSNKSGKKRDEFDLSDITSSPKKLSKEDIVAAAENAAFED